MEIHDDYEDTVVTDGQGIIREIEAELSKINAIDSDELWATVWVDGMECELQIKGLTREKMIEFLAEGK